MSTTIIKIQEIVFVLCSNAVFKKNCCKVPVVKKTTRMLHSCVAYEYLTLFLPCIVGWADWHKPILSPIHTVVGWADWHKPHPYFFLIQSELI